MPKERYNDKEFINQILERVAPMSLFKLMENIHYCRMDCNMIGSDEEYNRIEKIRWIRQTKSIRMPLTGP